MYYSVNHSSLKSLWKGKLFLKFLLVSVDKGGEQNEIIVNMVQLSIPSRVPKTFKWTLLPLPTIIRGYLNTKAGITKLNKPIFSKTLVLGWILNPKFKMGFELLMFYYV